MLWSDIANSIASATGAAFTIEKCQIIDGGCINTAYCVQNGGRIFFVKTNAANCHGMFAAEAAGLREIESSATVRVPHPICDGTSIDGSWLVLEYIKFGIKRDDRILGAQLAALHNVTAITFGWKCNNTIGVTPQFNPYCDDWLLFWRRWRLRFQLELATQNGAPKRLIAQGERLLADCGSLFTGQRIVPSLLHGDLWSGNIAFDEDGKPVLFDPAVYYGDREADLAMTELFGGIGPDFYAAYEEVHPRRHGYPLRRTFYNLYHILNHFNLFGGNYARQATAMIEELLAEIR